MRRVNAALSGHCYTIWLGLVIGFVGVLAGWQLVPVVSMQGEVVKQERAEVIVHVWGRKLRGDCRYVGISGYAGHGLLLHDARAERLDMPESGATKPAGAFDLGLWRIAPTLGADRALMYVTHSCGDGDVRTTKIADVALTGVKP